MLTLPVYRWGQPYSSMDIDEVVHFATGEPIAKVSRANGGLIRRDLRQAQRARDVLRAIPIDELITRTAKAGELYMNASLPMAMAIRHPTSSCTRNRPAPGCPSTCAART